MVCGNVATSVPIPLPLTGVTWNVYSVLGIRPVAVNTLLPVPVTVSVVGPKVTLYPVISLFLCKQFTLSHWRDTLLELEEETGTTMQVLYWATGSWRKD